MRFLHLRKFWIDDLGWPDISFGVHVCLDGRLDVHALKWVISFGKIPIYQTREGNMIAVSNSFHSRGKLPIRAGVK